jgi:hypothetical protein
MDNYITLKERIDVTDAPEVISVLPLGHVISDKGEFDVDSESFQAMKKQILKRGVDLVIDYEHQTLKGGQAPAAGWVKELMLKNGYIQARVEWNSAAVKYLKNKEYRYLSPVITVRKSDSKAMELHSLALTNTPAIEGMTPLVNSRSFGDTARKDSDDDLVDEIMGICERLGISSEDLAKYSGLELKVEPDHAKAFKLGRPDNATLLICKQLGISEEDLIKYGQL